MRIAIAGSTGLVGGAVAAMLETHGHELMRIGRASASDVAFDLTAGGALDPRALAGCDALVHAAGVTDEDFADPPRALAKAGRGAQALLDAARNAAVPRLAYVSSAHVYGPLEGVIDEGRATDPRSDYARAHLATEDLFRGAALQSGAALLIARPCAVYGMPPSLAHFARWSLIPFDFPRQAAQGRIVLKSHGEQRRNFVPAAGIASLVGWWLEQGPGGITANAPGHDELSVFDFATRCARIAREETGRDCALERPPRGDGTPRPLEYRTRVGGHLPGPSLEEHVRTLIRALLGKDRP